MTIRRRSKAAWLVAGACVLVAAFAWAAKATTMRIVGEDVTARIEFENGVGLTLTSKPTPVRPDTYWTKGLSLFKKDNKGRTWELRSNGVFGGYTSVMVEAEQDKVLLLGKPVGLRVTASAGDDERKVHVLAVTVTVAGQSGEQFLPGAFLDGKTMTMPAVAIKDEGGRVLASGRCALKENHYGYFAWPLPAGFTAKYDVEVEAYLGPFEYKLGKTIVPLNAK